MKYYFLGIILLISVSLNFAQNNSKGIVFRNYGFNTIFDKAKSENKIVLLYFYTSHCLPCRLMEFNVFTNDSVATFYNTNFISAKFNMEQNEGVEIAQKHNIYLYPTFLFLDNKGNLLYKISSSAPSQKFIQYGKDAIEKNHYYTR